MRSVALALYTTLPASTGHKDPVPPDPETDSGGPDPHSTLHETLRWDNQEEQE